MENTNFESFGRPVNVVVQGASRGLGLAFVRRLAEIDRVERVAATCRAPDRAEALQALVDDHDGLFIETLDVTDEATIEAAAERIEDRFDELHLLLNVAGLLHDEDRGIAPEKNLREIEPSSVLYNFEVNSLGPLLVLKHFARLMRHDGRTVVGNLSARVGSIGANSLGGWYSYRASKAAQNMFTRTAAIELERYRSSGQMICVALHPGTVDTDLSRPFQAHVPADQIFAPDEAAGRLLAVIDGLEVEDNGRFYDYAGEPIEW